MRAGDPISFTSLCIFPDPEPYNWQERKEQEKDESPLVRSMWLDGGNNLDVTGVDCFTSIARQKSFGCCTSE